RRFGSHTIARCTLLACTILTACGGSSKEAQSPSDTESRSSDGPSSFDSEQDSSIPDGPDCSDGTCFTCGEGICPVGAYCDNEAAGGSACAWLPECSGAPSCSCITKVLSGCTCDESAGGPQVSCK